MKQDKLIAYCELKMQHRQLEEQLDALREEIIRAYPSDTEFRLPEFTLKIVYQEKRHYDDRQLLEALPDPELWKGLYRADSAKIAALVKTGLLSDKALEGTYWTTKTPYLYVDPAYQA
jgi:hypothetical protein